MHSANVLTEKEKHLMISYYYAIAMIHIPLIELLYFDEQFATYFLQKL